MQSRVFISPSFVGAENLALDEYFLHTLPDDEILLYFYQNKNAVIIGKNQNPWMECDLDAMRRDGVELVRRVTGGGAVYHDLGNLNFSFIAPTRVFDRARQFSVLQKALLSLGIPCRQSGRNDLVAGDDARKFSGNAFTERRGVSQHHGTLLVSADLSRLAGYLTVDPKKIASKGISSVRSRVCNLNEFVPSLTTASLRDAIIRAFEEEYGKALPKTLSDADRAALSPYREKHASDAWRLGETPRFDYAFSERFPWGGVQILIGVQKGVVSSVHAYSDALETDLCEEIERCLLGIPFSDASLREALSGASAQNVRDLAYLKFV